MESSQIQGGNSEIVDSMSLVEYDVEDESFQATYDSAHDSACVAVISLVSTALGREPQDLTLLQSVIDTDALDELVTASATGSGTSTCISFRYEGFEITVTSDEVIAANHIESS